MKKITLAVLAALSSVGMVYSQATITVEAPVHTQDFVNIFPSGGNDAATITAVFFIGQSELTAITGTAITGMAVQASQGVVGAAANGPFTLYIANTSDAAYSASTSFTAVTSTMTPVYMANYNVPTGTGASTVNLNFTSAFTYTGGGLYVAYKWTSAGNLVTPNTNLTNIASYVSNSLGSATIVGGIEEVATNGTATGVLGGAIGRPAFLFKFNNLATNEVGILGLLAPGKVAKSINAGHNVKAFVRNNSLGTLTNITVSLTVNGANSFANTQTIPSIAPGASMQVTFAAFNPTVMGVNHLTVSTSADQNLANNKTLWTQSVTCNVMGNNPPDAASNYTSFAVGFPTGAGAFTSLFHPNANTTVTAVRSIVSFDQNVVGQKLFGLVIDDQGNLVGATDSIAITAAMLSSYVTFSFPAGQGVPLTANTDYFIGMAQPAVINGGSNYFAFAVETATDYVQGNYFASGIPDANNGATTFGLSKWGYLGIEPILGPDLLLSNASNSVICLGESIDLTASGANSYTWSVVPNTTVNTISSPSAAAISVVPTKTETVTFTLKGTDVAGCLATKTLVAKVSACTGLSTNALNAANIRVYPNPAVNGKTTVAGLEGTNAIAVYNILGEMVASLKTSDASASIDLSGRPAGTYLVRITDSNNQTKTVKIINQN